MQEDDSGRVQVWAACADLSKARRVTPIKGPFGGWPVWSPDGSRIAFDSEVGDANDVLTIAADGSDVRRLTDSVGVSGDPGWSPDGSLIAFEADRGESGKQGIYVADAKDGSGLRRVTTLPAGFSQDHAPRFSPDGRQLVFTRERSDSESALFTVNLDGSGLLKITTAELHPGDATWSPDGAQIAFEADLMPDRRAGPWVVNAAGTGARSLTGPQDPDVDWNGFSDPVWSPDGRLILVLQGIHHPDGSATAGLATIHPDGSNLRYITDGKGMEHQPDWSSRPC